MPLSIERLFERIKKNKGDINEKVVQNALYFLKENSIIDGIRRSRELDLKGTDFLVIIGTKKYKLQVKSSERGIEIGREEHLEKFPHNDLIFIRPIKNETKENLAERIIGEIKNFEERAHNERI